MAAERLSEARESLQVSRADLARLLQLDVDRLAELEESGSELPEEIATRLEGLMARAQLIRGVGRAEDAGRLARRHREMEVPEYLLVAGASALGVVAILVGLIASLMGLAGHVLGGFFVVFGLACLALARRVSALRCSRCGEKVKKRDTYCPACAAKLVE